jgi:hypothetical protein
MLYLGNVPFRQTSQLGQLLQGHVFVLSDFLYILGYLFFIHGCRLLREYRSGADSSIVPCIIIGNYCQGKNGKMGNPSVTGSLKKACVLILHVLSMNHERGGQVSG